MTRHTSVPSPGVLIELDERHADTWDASRPSLGIEQKWIELLGVVAAGGAEGSMAKGQTNA